MKKQQFLAICVGLLIVIVLGFRFFNDKEGLLTRVDAVGSLVFTFNELPPDAPVFSEMDVKPGDCYTREVVASNEGLSDVDIGVRSRNVVDPDDMRAVLTMLIEEEGQALYGQTSVGKFVLDSDDLVGGVYLSLLPAGEQTTYSFTVCMPFETGNEYQRKSMVFDLIFGRVQVIEVPPECRPLRGKIQHLFEGTEEGEFIHGTIENDLIYGYGGDDHIDGSGGDDCVVGGLGKDHLEGEDGNDVLVGGEGDDWLEAGSGDDIVFGGGGVDEIKSGSGNDQVWAGGGDDVIDAATGDDFVYAGEGRDTVYGKSGDDEVHGEEGNDYLHGGSGNDELYGGSGDDEMLGRSGNDWLDGGNGYDNLTGNSGTDICINGEVLASCE